MPEIISGTYQYFLGNDCFIKSNPLVKISIHNSYQNSTLKYGCYNFILGIKIRHPKVSLCLCYSVSSLSIRSIISSLYCPASSYVENSCTISQGTSYRPKFNTTSSAESPLCIQNTMSGSPSLS